MKFFSRIKEFFKNVFSGDYDHATQSMNEFLATGKFPDKAEKPKTDLIDKQTVSIKPEVVKTDIPELTEEKVEIIDAVAKKKDVYVKLEDDCKEEK